MLTMFEKTIVLLRNQQEDMHFLRVELQAVKRHTESQANTYQEVLASVRNLGLSPVEGERLKRSRHHLRTSQHLEVPPLSTYSTLSSVHRTRRPCATSSPIVVGAEGGTINNNSRDTLFDRMFPEDQTQSVPNSAPISRILLSGGKLLFVFGGESTLEIITKSDTLSVNTPCIFCKIFFSKNVI